LSTQKKSNPANPEGAASLMPDEVHCWNTATLLCDVLWPKEVVNTKPYNQNMQSSQTRSTMRSTD